jgi:apolipoprotein N-acyltransferase
MDEGRFRSGWRGVAGLVRGPLRVLVSGQALGQLGDGLAQVAFAQLVLFDIGRGATPARIAGVLAATLLPFSVVGPLAGVFIDRWNRRRVLVVTSWLRSALAVGGVVAALNRSEVAAYLGVLLLLSSSRFILDAKGAVLPRLVGVADLVRANAVSGLAGMIAAFAGAVGAAMFVSASVPAGFLAAAFCYLLASVVFRRLPFVGGGVRQVHVAAALRRVARELAGGLRAVAATAELRRPLLAVWTHRLLLGGGFVLLVLVADHRYRLTASGYALALAITGVSAFAGTLAAPSLVTRWRPQIVLPLAFLPPAAAAIVVGYAPSLPGLLVAVAVTAVSFQCLKVLTDALVGRAAPDRVRGRVFALYDVLYNLAFVSAGLAMVPLWQPGHERALLWWLGAAFAVGWLVFARVVRGWPFVTAVRPPIAHCWPMRAAALLSGAIPVLAFPKPGLWWAAWFALVPVLVVVRRAPCLREAVLRGWWCAVGFLIAVHYWLLPSTTLFLPVVAAMLALLWIPWAALTWHLLAAPLSTRRLAAAVLVIPAAWVVAEAVRSWSALGGPWGLLGASQWRSPVFLAPASLGGVWLVSYLIVTANVAVTVLVEARWLAPRMTAAFVLVAAVLAGPLWYAAEPAPDGDGQVTIAVVQAGVVHDPAARLQTELGLTERLPASQYDLVIWGESSVGFDLVRRADLQRQLQQQAARLGSDLLVNVDATSASGDIRKTAVLVAASGINGTYSKMRLVPFGEYIPARPVLGWLASITEAAGKNRLRGKQIEVFKTGELTFAPLICFESAFPDMSRQAALAGAELLVFQSATTTFQGSWAADQHASLAAVRAVEAGRPAVQATLAGTTAAFDSQGHQLVWWSASTGTVTFTLPLAARHTPYGSFGDWVPAWSVAALAASASKKACREVRESAASGCAQRVSQRTRTAAQLG